MIGQRISIPIEQPFVQTKAAEAKLERIVNIYMYLYILIYLYLFLYCTYTHKLSNYLIQHCIYT
jgi:hypothetical protein